MSLFKSLLKDVFDQLFILKSSEILTKKRKLINCIQRQGMTLTRMGKTIWRRYKNLEKEMN